MRYTNQFRLATETIETIVNFNGQDLVVKFTETIETTEAGDDRSIEIKTANDLETGAEFDGDWDALEKHVKNS